MGMAPQTPGGSPGQIDAPADEAAAQDTSQNSPAADPGDGQDDGVPVQNRVAEYRRKFTQTKDRLAQKQLQLEQAQERIRALEAGVPGRGTPVSPTPAPVAGTSPGAAPLTAAQKRELYNQGFGYDVAVSEMDQKLAEERAANARAQEYRDLQAQAAAAAVARYPQLNDASSEFYEAVSERVTTILGQAAARGVEAPPDAVLNAANDVAMSGNYQVATPESTNVDPSWDAAARIQAADRGTPPPASASSSVLPADVGELPAELKRINAMTRTLGSNPAERAAALEEFIANDPVSQEALAMRGGNS